MTSDLERTYVVFGALAAVKGAQAMAFEKIAHDVESLVDGHGDEEHGGDFCGAVGVGETLVAPCDDPSVEHVLEVVVEGARVGMEEMQRGEGSEDILVDEGEGGLGEETG